MYREPGGEVGKEAFHGHEPSPGKGISPPRPYSRVARGVQMALASCHVAASLRVVIGSISAPPVSSRLFADSTAQKQIENEQVLFSRYKKGKQRGHKVRTFGCIIPA